MGESFGGDHVSVGVRKPNGEYERPIAGTRLFRTKPGDLAVCSQTDNAFAIIKKQEILGCHTFLEKICLKKRIYSASLVFVKEQHR